MKHTFKKSIAVILATLMLLTAAPMAGFVGLELPMLSVGLAAESKEFIDGGTTEDGLSWAVYDNGELVISGEGEMQDYFEKIPEEEPTDALTELTEAGEENLENSADLNDYYLNITPWVDYQHEITSVTVEDGITAIGRQAFFVLYKAVTVSLPDTLVTIGRGAFAVMLSLKEITLPESVKTIGGSAFEGCISLEKIDIPDGAEFTGSWPFGYCFSLKELIIPGTSEVNLLYLADSGLYSLEKLVFEEGATAICSEDDDLLSVSLPSLTYLSIPSTFENDCIFDVESSPLLREVHNYSRTMSVLFVPTSTIPEKYVKFMIDYEKQMAVADLSDNCTFDISSFEYDTSVLELGEIFEGSDVDVDASLALLNQYFSSDFSSLSEFVFWLETLEFMPNTTQSGACIVYCYADSAQHRLITECEDELFLRHILLDSGAECLHESILTGDYYISGEDDPSETTVHWEIDPKNRTLLLSGGGDHAFGLHSILAALSYLYDSVAFAPDSNFTSISDSAFAGISIKEITIPATVKSIGQCAFEFCNELTTIRFEDGFQLSDAESFLGLIAPYCENFTAYEVTESNPYYTSVDGLLYDKECKTLLAVPTGLTEVSNIVETVESIHPNAFTLCGIKEITIPDSVAELPHIYCTFNLETLHIGKNTRMPYSSEEGMIAIVAPSLKNINVHQQNHFLCFEDGVLYSYDKTTLLHYCATNKDKEYTIAKTVKHIAPYAFAFNEYLRNIIIPANVESIDSFSIYSANVYWDLTPCSVTFLNPTTEIYDDIDTISEWMPIYGYVGSTAEAYALKYDRTFVELTECYHYGGMATCECKAICTLCGQEYGELGDHVESTFTQEESCTVNGYILTVCDLCGEQLSFETIPAAHSWGEWIETKTATCVQVGEETRTCGRCGETESRETAIGDHDFSTEWTVDVDSTCSQEGSQSRHCKYCSATTDTKPVEKKEHTFGEWYVVTEPTLLSDGKKERKCSACSATEEEATDKLLYKEYVNEETGVGVGVTKEAYGGKDITVEIEEVFDGSQFVTNNYGKIRTWNIKTHLNGVQVQPLEPVYIRIPLPADYNANRIFVYHVNSQTGVSEKLASEVIDGYICFYTDSFSRFIIVDESSLIETPDPEEPTEPDVPDEPDTPDEPEDPADNCSHLCHSEGIMGFFWKIIRFFWKLFGMNPVCECGTAHY